MNKILVIGGTSAGKSSLINMLSLQLTATTTPDESITSNNCYKITKGPLSGIEIIDTQGLKDDNNEEIENLSAYKEFERFAQDRTTMCKIVLYVLDNTSPYINSMNKKCLEKITGYINKINNKQDLIVFGVIINKCDKRGMKREKVYEQLNNLGIGKETINFVSSYQILLDNITTLGIDLEICNTYDKEELKSLFKDIGYLYTRAVVNGYNERVIKNGIIKKKKNDDTEDDSTNNYSNIYKNIIGMIETCKEKKSEHLSNLIKIDLESIVETMKEERTDEIDTGSITCNIRNYININQKNIDQIVDLFRNAMDDYKKHKKVELNIIAFIGLTEMIGEISLYTLILEYISSNINELVFESLYKGFIMISEKSELLKKNKHKYQIINKLLTKTETYNQENYDKLLTLNTIPMNYRHFLKIATIDIRNIKLLLLSGIINASHFSIFDNQQEVFIKFCYLVNVSDGTEEYYKEKIYNYLTGEIKDDVYKNFIENCKYLTVTKI